MDLIESKKNDINRHPWELSRTHCLINEIKKYHIFGDILDIGCGDSYFDFRLMEEIKDINNFYGIDIFVQEEYKDGKYKVVNDYKKLKNKKFDMILMFDVLEHIKDDSIFLDKTVKPLLKDGGKIIMSVPAYQSLYSLHDKELKHYRRYNIKMMKDVCNKASFKIIKYHYFYASLVLVRIVTKLFKKDNKVNEWNKSEKHWFTQLITKVLNLDYWICKKMNKLSFGLSLFIVLEKK